MNITEKIKQIREVKQACESLGYSLTGQLLREYADLLESIDKAEPVGEVIEGYGPHGQVGKCLHAAKSIEDLPIGTKIYTHPPKQEPVHIFNRWNIEQDSAGLLICFNNHEKGEKCEYERYVLKQEQSPIDERAEFEKEAKKLGYEIVHHGDSYFGLELQCAWVIWCAARKLSTPITSDVAKLYEELICTVESKFSNETRHETALRYIRDSERVGTNAATPEDDKNEKSS